MKHRILNPSLSFLFALLLLAACTPEKPPRPSPPEYFELTDSAGIALQNYLLADSGHWQFTESWYIYGKTVVNGNDTQYVVKDSTDYYPGSSAAIGSDSLHNHVLEFYKVVSVKDEMEIRIYYEQDRWFYRKGPVTFDYANKIVFGGPNMWYAPFSEGHFQIDAIQPDHMWIHTLRHDFFNDYFKVYYKLEKRP